MADAENRFSDLVSYFEYLATNHKAIGHTASLKHFYRFELEEVLTASCMSINYPALILEGYDFSYQDAQSDNIIKTRTGAFIIIDKVKDLKNFNEIHAVWDRCEKIGDDILIRMRSDKRGRGIKVLRGFDLSDSRGSIFGVKQLGQYGIRFEFALGCVVESDIDESVWLT